MLLSRSCEYGIRAALYLAGRPAGQLVPIRTVSEALGMPYPFLAKVAQALIGAGVLTSERGPHGGVGLARPGTEITLKEIVVAIDGPEVFTECVLGLPGCGNRQPCPLHAQWAVARGRVHDMFAGATLAATAERIRTEGLRLDALLGAPLKTA
jgi:Rrf2 family transcriptional regulator, iron-sulfur cluster assembly transcription factor